MAYALRDKIVGPICGTAHVSITSKNSKDMDIWVTSIL